MNREEILQALKDLPVIELAGLVKDLEEEFGVSAAAAAPVAVAAAPAAGDSGAAAEQEEFTVTLKDVGDNKINVIKAVRAAVEKANWKIDEIDLFEINEAFAAQSIAVINELKIDKNKVNVNGGASALGHPIGASGARILVTLLHEMKKQNKKKGCVTLCIGGGMGIALCVERD